MSKLSPDVEKLLEHVDRVSGAPANTTELIRTAIESSPYLQKRMSTEIAQGNLERIAVRDGDKQWGHFDDPNRTAALDVDLFKQFAQEPARLQDAITHVLGHEVGHGNNLADRNRGNRALNEDNGCTAYVEPLAVGDPLPDMPVFLDRRLHVPVPLEPTYQATWQALPEVFRTAVETGVLPDAG